MDTAKALLVLATLMRTAHMLAGGVWIGGSIVYLVVITPALRLGKATPEVSARMGGLFRRLVNVCIVTLLLTGVYLTFDRLSATTVGAAYLVTLGVKIALALVMFTLAALLAQEARRPARRRGRLWREAPRAILGLGIVVFLLGATLMALFEVGLGLAR
jgi:putative copper export protein